MSSLSPLYNLRPATMADAETVTNLLNECDISEYGVPDSTIEDVLDIWNDIQIETNTWIIEKEASIVGYGYLEEMSKGRLDCYGYVHPSHRSEGIGSFIIDQMEARANQYLSAYQKEGISYQLNFVISATNLAAVALIESKGYQFARVFSRMSITIENKPDIPRLPENINIMPFQVDRDGQALYDAYCESFRDTREYYEEPFEKWLAKVTKEPYDPTLSFVAYDDQSLVGFIICKNYPEGTFIDLLGVKSSSRKKGIGASLLTTVFTESYQRKIPIVMLNVDSKSLTGANRLYESVGMKATFQIAVYQKTN